MTRRLLIIDDFLSDPDGVRLKALTAGFESVEFKGHTYHGVGRQYDPRLTDRLSAAVGGLVDVRMQFFRIGMSGVDLTTFIHADTACDEWAAVLYLSEGQGGTAFWKHRELGIEAVPDPRNISQEFADKLNADGNDEALWKMNLFVPMRYNRLVVYPTRFFHSRYPNVVEAPTAADGRLVWVAFFSRGQTS